MGFVWSKFCILDEDCSTSMFLQPKNLGMGQSPPPTMPVTSNTVTASSSLENPIQKCQTV